MAGPPQPGLVSKLEFFDFLFGFLGVGLLMCPENESLGGHVEPDDGRFGT